ncbi:AMP-binding enzyme [Amycolatopsis dendrobii]|uniref:AMP-binding enzyme C-terminal domain-containing protein n=1 Tax=Amycolatopsis dendrobii TaxID=2760662 RepID=A0A7W3Z9B4_9PSEU|nr:hypothetical protein [Amycolatopsis dendrobii]MBB1152428.1 hypothetical protein [Amycolatopsis dendrobii]
MSASTRAGVGVELDDGGYWMPLFVTLTDGARLDEPLRQRILAAIRRGASARHVPDEVIAAPGIPHTRTGKKLEVPVKRLLLGDDPDAVVDSGSVDQPELLDRYRRFQHRRSAVRQAALHERSEPADQLVD